MSKGNAPALTPAVRHGVPGWLTKSGRFMPIIAGGDLNASTELQSKLKNVEAELKDLRDERADKAKEMETAKEAFAAVDGYDADSPEFKAAEEAVRAVGEIAEQIASKQIIQTGILKMLGQNPDAQREKEQAETGTEAPSQRAWQAKAMFEREGVREILTKASTSKARIGGIELGEIADRDAFKADITGSTDQRTGPFYGTIPQIYRPLRVLDLIPTGTMDNNQFPYTQESGTFLAAEVTEGSSKPEDGVVFTDANAVAETIAAWQKIRKQALADISALQSIVENRLRYSVQRRLETQVLSGSGSTPNLQGILGAAGISTVTHGVDLTDSAPGMDLILEGMTKIILSDCSPSGIVMNPTDWSEALRSKATGDGQYFSNGPFNTTAQSMWGLPLIPSPAIPLGEALVGDFQIGAQLFIREGVNVLLSDSDQSDFIQNRVTLLGEMRAALAIWRPSAFCLVNLKEIS